MPGLADVESQLAVPLMAMGRFVGVLMVESAVQLAFDETDEATLTVVAGMIANAIEIDRGPGARPRRERAIPATPRPAGRPSCRRRRSGSSRSTAACSSAPTTSSRAWPGASSGRCSTHTCRRGGEEFTNREVRLDPTLELPEYRDNLESRLILLKRRLDERDAPVRIEKTGRGRFRLVVTTPLQLEIAGA